MKMRFTVQTYSAVPTSHPTEELPRNEDDLVCNTSNGKEIFNVVHFKSSHECMDANDPSQLDGLLKQSQESIATQSYVDNVTKPTTNVKFLKSAEKIAERGRQFAKRQTHRLVFKDGNCNVSTKNVPKRKKRYLVDIFTTLVDMKWRYNLIMFTTAFVGSWFFFTFFWWSIAVAHGDHTNVNDTDWEPCVTGVYDFPTALLFSVETQHTIGYGTRAIEPNCGFAIFLLMLQSCFGVFIQSLMTGLVFSKLSRPKHRAQTMMFSKFAVICQRDGEYCLLFRVGDMRRSHIIGTSIRALVVKNRLTEEGELIPLCQHTLDLETETNFNDSFVFLVWPVTVVHRIDKTSPLWSVSAEEMLTARFEIIVILEGIVENTGMTTQFRTSYLPSEILWGYRLAPLLTFEKENGHYEIDFSQFHEVVIVTSMPECSAMSNAEKEYSSARKDEDYPINFTAPRVRHQSQGSTLRKTMLKRKLKKSKNVDQSDCTPDSLQRSIQSLSDRKFSSGMNGYFKRRASSQETGRLDVNGRHSSGKYGVNGKSGNDGNVPTDSRSMCKA